MFSFKHEFSSKNLLKVSDLSNMFDILTDCLFQMNMTNMLNLSSMGKITHIKKQYSNEKKISRTKKKEHVLFKYVL